MRLLALTLLCILLPAATAPARDLDCRVVLLDGDEISGSLLRVEPERIHLEGRDRPIACHELREIAFVGAAPRSADDGADRPGGASPDPDDPAARAFVRFAGGEVLAGRLLGCDGKGVRLLVRGRRTAESPAGESVGEIAVPLTALRAFRLREPHASDAVFEETLAGPPPETDLVFVRREDRLIRIECVFRSLDDDEIAVEYMGSDRRIRRNRIQGVILAPVAGTEIESGDEGTLRLHGGGRIPVRLQALSFRRDRGVEVPRLEVTVQGGPWQVDLRHVEAVSFAGDRVRFLSDLEPSRSQEVSFLGGSFPWRRDLSVGGGPIRLGGVEYRRGLGVRSRSILEWDLGEPFASFVARVGIDDGVGRRGNAAARVLGDGRKLFETSVAGGAEPVEVRVSLLGVRKLTLETDYGEDGIDLGDHVDWAEARLVKPPRGAAAESTTERTEDTEDNTESG